MVPNSSKKVVAQLPKLFKDRVSLGASWIFEGAGLGGSDEGWFGGQALVVDLRQSLGHHERGWRDGVRQSETFGDREKVAESTPPGEAVVVGEKGDCSIPSSSVAWKETTSSLCVFKAYRPTLSS